MISKTDKSIKESSPYTAVITREQFLFPEMRITAGLLSEKLSDEEIKKRIYDENMFQYPTEKSVNRMVDTCLKRLRILGDSDLIEAIAKQPSDISKQICLYAMMKQYRLVWDFMITVIGNKYQTCDMFFSRKDLNVFMMRLQEQDDWVATWSESTVTKIKQVLAKLLVENEYIDSLTSNKLNPVLISSVLESAIRSSGDTSALIAFNCYS